ncbi:MAG: DUF1588 domain-containing protein, partial [Acidobacteria bacterium]|nr:DUF1588 domain-containing protein [Acidobacteriota bacterium]
RGCWPAPTSCSASRSPRSTCRPPPASPSPTTTSPRGCRSSSGRPCRTPSSSIWPRRRACRNRTCSSGRCGGCWPIPAPRRWPRASRPSGCGCRTWRRCSRTCASTRTSTSSSRRETELFFLHLLREDRSVLELLDADWTFVNERLARHYGIPGVVGSGFRRVTYPPGEPRRGLLGHGSVLALTSYADRTSPVLRGKWAMEVLLGSPPPPPPPDVPDLEDTVVAEDGRLLSVRARARRAPRATA